MEFFSETFSPSIYWFDSGDSDMRAICFFQLFLVTCGEVYLPGNTPAHCKGMVMTLKQDGKPWRTEPSWSVTHLGMLVW